MDGAGHAACSQGKEPGCYRTWQLTSRGEWVSTPGAIYEKAVASLQQGFKKLGLAHAIGWASCSPLQRVDYVQLGVMAAGAVAVGLDPHALDANTQDIARRCHFAGVVLGNPSMLEKLGDEGAPESALHRQHGTCAVPGSLHSARFWRISTTTIAWNGSQPTMRQPSFHLRHHRCP